MGIGFGEGVGVGAIDGAKGTTGASDEVPELPVLGTSFSFGMSLGGAAGVVVGMGAIGASQGETVGPQQSGFLQQLLILSSRLGRYERSLLQESQLGAGAHPLLCLGVQQALIRSRMLALAQPQDEEATVGPQLAQAWA